MEIKIKEIPITKYNVIPVPPALGSTGFNTFFTVNSWIFLSLVISNFIEYFKFSYPSGTSVSNISYLPAYKFLNSIIPLAFVIASSTVSPLWYIMFLFKYISSLANILNFAPSNLLLFSPIFIILTSPLIISFKLVVTLLDSNVPDDTSLIIVVEQFSIVFLVFTYSEMSSFIFADIINVNSSLFHFWDSRYSLLKS